jgi:hypothetical protein
VNLDMLARSTEGMDEAAFVARFPNAALVYRMDPGKPKESDLETDQYKTAPPPPKPADIVGASIVLFVKKQAGSPEGPVTLGRGKENDIALPLGNISRLHASISEGPSGWTLTDHKSTNGTFLEQERIAAGVPVALKEGAWVRFGTQATVKFYTPRGLFAFLSQYRTAMQTDES